MKSEDKMSRLTPSFEFGDPKDAQKALHYLVNISDRLQTLNGTIEQMKEDNNALK